MRAAVTFSFFMVLGKTLKDWRQVCDAVVTAINYDKASPRNPMATLEAYFNAQPILLIPQQPKLFKFNIGDTVLVDAPKSVRRDFAFKYSLQPGNYPSFMVKFWFFSNGKYHD